MARRGRVTRITRKARREEPATLMASLTAYQLNISKKRRLMGKRVSLNRLILLTRRVRDWRGCPQTALNFSWNTKREKSNTTTKRRDLSSFSVAGKSGSHSKINNDASDPINVVDVKLDEGTKALFVNNDVSAVVDKLDEEFKPNLLEVDIENVVPWIPATPIFKAASVGFVEKENAMTTENPGKYESLLDILKSRAGNVFIGKTRRKRMKMKRHNPKVLDPNKNVKPSTPKPRTPKFVPKEKNTPIRSKNGHSKKQSRIRKLDFDEASEVGKVDPPRKGKKRKIMGVRVSCEQTWSCMDSTNFSIEDEEAFIDFIVQKMEALHIEEKSSHALVHWKEKREIEASKNHKAMIDFDPETLRVWDLFITNKLSESFEEKDAENEEVMKKKKELHQEIETFVSRLDLFQGERNFSPWKGSVLDSIIGVFLTQNVSDSLSSNAFMQLAAAYPPLSLSEQNLQFARDDEPLMVDGPSSQESVESNPNNDIEIFIETMHESLSQVETAPRKDRKRRVNPKQKPEIPINWDDLRKQYFLGTHIRTECNADSVNWEAVRQASAEEIAKVILDRGMNNQLAGRIKGFLDRLMRDHNSLDLEWLRDIPPMKAKDYLLSVSGLGLKSTECVRLLSIHVPAFPIDVNAARVYTRLGWVPLKPLPEDVKLHLLNQYPLLDSVQKYMWPNLCHYNHPFLYKFHCQSITFSKSFCTKTKPKCNECPMSDKCKHYASLLASSGLLLEAETDNGSSQMPNHEPKMLANPDGDEPIQRGSYGNCEPIIDFPPSPKAESEPIESLGNIEDTEGDSEFLTIKLNDTEFLEKYRRLIDDDPEISKALVINHQVGRVSLPEQKIKERLRTVHQVYELPDSHPLLAGFEAREADDPCPYLLAIWMTDEAKNTSQDSSNGVVSCSSREVVEFEKHESVKGTILIPCRTANKGRFPLNGTYFQIHEVFADKESSDQPMDVPTKLIWNLRKRTLYCGTSITTICRGMTFGEVVHCFRRSFICIRAFDRRTRRPKQLSGKLHICKTRKPEDE